MTGHVAGGTLRPTMIACLVLLRAVLAYGLVHPKAGPTPFPDARGGLVILPQHNASIPDATGGPLHQRRFTIRYTFLDPNFNSTYLHERGLPALMSAHCTAETYLAPALLAADFIQVMPDYVVYTNRNTHSAAQTWVDELPEEDGSRIRLINLDEDANDAERMKPFLPMKLNDVNVASVRRTLADAIYLSSETSRLLLGTDISFMHEPRTFIAEASKLSRGQAMYMWDDVSFKGQLYKVTDYKGPQCGGLLGDFIFLAPGVHISLDSITEKMLWYAHRKVENYGQFRIDPQCIPCDNVILSNYMHAIDQFGMAMALGEATADGDQPGCIPLPTPAYHTAHGLCEMRSPQRHEAIHDKCIPTSMCGFHSAEKADMLSGPILAPK